MPEGKRILYLGGRLGFEGGIERYMFHTAALLRRNGCTVCCAGDGPGREPEKFRAGFDRVMTPEEAVAEAEAFDLAALHKPCSAAVLERYQKAFGPRLVFWAHDHDVYCPRRYYYTPFGRKNCSRACSTLRCAGCALLASPRRWQGGIGGQLRFLLSEAPRRLELLRGIRTVVISEFMRGNLLRNGFDGEKIRLIPPFIEPEPAAPVPSGTGELRLLFLGQLLRGKGCDLFLRMLARLKIPFRATVAGDGNDRPMLEAQCRESRLQERVRFLGWHLHPEELFAEHDLAVFPFRWQEPFGLCGLEAIAHGVPVVAFDVGGVREWLVEERTGIPVGPFDLDAMAGAVTRFYDSPELRRQMRQACMMYAREGFSPQRFLAGFEKLVEEAPE
ncbi:MAG: glycosyltransferase family 4 protein [Lentisphaeria bacterium]|nr:glycosyltransferase family 4 protein [Lentisphaeria bacterium]